MPAHTEYRASLPTGMPIPSAPRSPQTKDALTIGDHNHLNIVERPVTEQFCHSSLVAGGDVNTAWPPEDMAKLQAGLPDGGRVNDGHQLLDIIEQYPVEEGFVAILQSNQIHIALDVGGLLAQIFQNALHLFIQGMHPGRQQTG